MKRRNFLKKAAVATAGAFATPYILPSGRLFAATGQRIADHVVFCLFAGGVRNLESMEKAEGNLMPYTLNGNESVTLSGMTPLPAPSGPRLQTLGTLYKEARFTLGPTGHFSGHSTAITGRYNLADINIKQRPAFPTIFELYRKHNSPSMSALNAWWVSNALGPYPALNFSNHASYGATYGANYIQPLSLISQAGYDELAHPKSFSQSDVEKVEDLKEFFDSNFANQFKPGDAGVINPKSDAAQLEDFINTSLTEASAGQYNDPWGVGIGAMNGDMFNMFMAGKIIQRFKPELTVVNMQDIDVCHSNFTSYCNNIRRADFALSKLWQTIQSTPGMQDNTILIVAPEHGRNLAPNTLVDQNGRYALDHTSDEMSRRIFTLVVGPSGKVVQNQVISNEMGQSVDIVPTIAKILGFYDEVPGGTFDGAHLQAAFV